MTKLEQLIEELCPNGVEYLKIGEVVNYEQPSKYIVNSTDYNDDFEVPVLTAGQTFILGYTNEKSGIYNASKEAPVIIFDDFTGAFKWVDFPFKVKSSAMKILTVNDCKTYIRYIFHVMGHIGYSSTEHKRLWIGLYSEFEIPVPPLPVQSEIVRILDNFTELTAELTTELTARKTQYETYRNKLFDIECETVPITAIAHTYIGLVTTMTKHYVPQGVKLIHNSSIKENRFELKENIFLDEDFAIQNNSRRHKIGDIITVHTGDVGTSAIIDEELDGSLGFATIVSRIYDTTVVMPKYVCYYLNSRRNKQNIVSMIKGDRNNLNLKDFNKLTIPVPPIKEQERIVAILDRFDTLCNDISAGLPAEIEARQKQYEYYRDKLLTFKALST